MKRTIPDFDDEPNVYDERPTKIQRSDPEAFPRRLELNLSGSMSLSPSFLETLSETLCGSAVVSLNLSFCNYLVDDDLALLMGDRIHSNLEYLNLSFTHITDIGVMFVASKCPHLTRVILKGCHGITHVALSYVAQNCKFLQELVISECPNIGDLGVRLIAQEAKKNLVLLDLSDCPKIIEDKTLLYLAHFCPNLSILRLKNTFLSMTILAKLLATQNRLHLTELNLQGNHSIMDSFLSLLCKFQKTLKVLDVSFCPNISFRTGIQKIVSSLDKLSELHAFGLKISEGDCESVRLLKPSLSIFVC